MQSRLVYLALISALMIIQISATIANRNFWPISSFNVFANSVGEEAWVVKVLVGNGHGEKQVADPGHVLPVEFFKARSILVATFGGSSSLEEKNRFAEAILDRLRHRRWTSFDEVLPPVEVEAPDSLQIELWRLDSVKRNETNQFLLRERVLLFRTHR